ncbi:hypothetical protein BaRGS_00037901 [Batillaria attramentaria]|uniref:Uncharacterized protein n=1 Tax=Batillaria attramentaria TaxID=370345 RepID=A0ABD0J7U0_9CAEN
MAALHLQWKEMCGSKVSHPTPERVLITKRATASAIATLSTLAAPYQSVKIHYHCYCFSGAGMKSFATVALIISPPSCYNHSLVTALEHVQQAADGPKGCG